MHSFCSIVCKYQKGADFQKIKEDNICWSVMKQRNESEDMPPKDKKKIYYTTQTGSLQGNPKLNRIKCEVQGMCE